MPYQLDSVGLEIDGRQILSPLTLDLPRGCIVGQNGSGKLSLLRLLARQTPPSAGEVRFGGKPVASFAAREFARQVAYLAQTPPPVQGLLVREFVAFGRYPWHGALGRFGAEDAREVAEAMRLTGVEPLSDRLIETLSGGERQRVWLAMLIAQKADCLLLDEPISALDIAHQIEMMRLIRDLGRQRSVAAVVVLHDVNMAARYCDHIVALRDGKLLMNGPPAALMHAEQLEAIYGIAMGVMPHPSGGSLMSYVH